MVTRFINFIFSSCKVFQTFCFILFLKNHKFLFIQTILKNSPQKTLEVITQYSLICGSLLRNSNLVYHFTINFYIKHFSCLSKNEKMKWAMLFLYKQHILDSGYWRMRRFLDFKLNTTSFGHYISYRYHSVLSSNRTYLIEHKYLALYKPFVRVVSLLYLALQTFNMANIWNIFEIYWNIFENIM